MSHPHAVVDLSRPGVDLALPLAELSGGRASAETRCRLQREGDRLVFTLLASDPDPLSLIATAPSGDRPDPNLFEEDVLQLAIAWPGGAEPDGFVLVNPHLNRRALGDAVHWEFEAHRGAEGWSIRVGIPLRAGVPAVGLSALRFYRGVHHEVHALGGCGPHPVEPDKMAVVLLAPGDAARAEADFRAQAREAHQRRTDAQLVKLRARLADRHRPGAHPASRATLDALIAGRLARPVESALGHLCWNEQHFQNCLLDLWDLTADRRYIDAAIPRVEQVFALRADRHGILDKHWNAVLPTWYNQQGHWAMPLVTGVILYPIARLLRAVHASPALTDLRPHVEPWIELCRQSVAVHDREWVELPGGRGNYLEWDYKGPRRVYPSGGSRLCPLNRGNFLGVAMVDLHAVTGEAVYRDRVTKLARFFRDGCELTSDGQLLWEYMHTRYATIGEDISHAACQTLFADACFADGVVITEADLRAIARTLSTLIFRFGDVPAGTIRGFDPTLDLAVAGHAMMTRYEPEALPKIVAVVETMLSEDPGYFEREGWAMRAISLIERARAASPGV